MDRPLLRVDQGTTRVRFGVDGRGGSRGGRSLINGRHGAGAGARRAWRLGRPRSTRLWRRRSAAEEARDPGAAEAALLDVAGRLGFPLERALDGILRRAE